MCSLSLADTTRLQTLIQILASEKSSDLSDCGHQYAMTHAASTLQSCSAARELMSGLTQVRRCLQFFIFRLTCGMGGWWRWALLSPDGVAPSVSASVNLPLHHKVQRFSTDTGSPGWSRKKGRKTVVVVVVTCGMCGD